jgi:hypothetical protein
MKKSILRISIYVAIATVLTVVLLTSCTTRRIGCPINAQHGFGPGRIR